ncbi:FtsX-like permease family protein [Baekduia sp. Peel2402]|uniref:FtsX-like permease family protein n=1 Tax=Baekduia sp. Peel2402 TaxID=3458296 RepID=UPI00403E6E23
MTAVLTVLRYVNLRDVRRRPRRVLLSVLGIAGSVGLILSMLVIHATLERTVARTSGLPQSTGLVVAAASGGPLAADTATAIRAVPRVGAVVPIVRQVTRLASGEGRGGAASERVVVLGLPPRGFRLLDDTLRARGRLAGDAAAGGLTLSGPLAAALGARAGGTVTLDTPGGRVAVRVSHVLAPHTGATFNGGVFAILGLAAAQRLFDHHRTVDLIYAYPGASAGGSQEALRRAVDAAVGPGVTVERPEVQQAAFARTFDAIAGTVGVVALIGLLIGIFLVFNTVAMSVAERRRLIAIAGLAGAGPGALVVASVLEAALVGAVGGAVGVGLGYAVAQVGIAHVEATYAGVLPVTEAGDVQLSVGEVVAGVGIGMVVAMAGAALAGRRILAAAPASGVRPAESYAVAAAYLRGSAPLAIGGAAAVAGGLVLAANASSGLATGWTVVVMALSLIGVGLVLPLLVRGVAGAVGAGVLGRIGVAGRLAAAGLARAPGRTVLTVAALTAALAVTVAVGTGTRSFEREARQVVGNWTAAPLYVRAPGAGPLMSDQPLHASLAGGLGRVHGVEAAYPMRFVLLGQRTHVAVLAMPIVAAARRGDVLTRDVRPGDRATIAALARGEVVVSRLLARRRGVGVGDRIRLPVAHGDGRFTVAGLFNDINSDDSLYMDLTTFQRVTGDRDADRFALFPVRGAAVDDVAAATRQLLARRDVGATVATGPELTTLVVDTVRGLFSFAHLALLAASLVAALTITNTLLTATLERRRELAVQRMLGMRPLAIAWSMLLEGAALAAVAAVIGIGVGLVLGFVVLQLAEGQLAWRIGLHLDLGLVVGALVTAPVLGAVAAAYPGWLATRPSLVSVLKDE